MGSGDTPWVEEWRRIAIGNVRHSHRRAHRFKRREHAIQSCAIVVGNSETRRLNRGIDGRANSRIG
jgi:hypothetical protein